MRYIFTITLLLALSAPLLRAGEGLYPAWQTPAEMVLEWVDARPVRPIVMELVATEEDRAVLASELSRRFGEPESVKGKDTWSVPDGYVVTMGPKEKAPHVLRVTIEKAPKRRLRQEKSK